jgi:GTP cyclohydrolase IA
VEETQGAHLSKEDGRHRIEDAARQMLVELAFVHGLNITDPNFKETPERIARAYSEIFSGLRDTDKKIDKILSTAFPCQSDSMVLVRDIEVFSMCPHHFLPVEMTVHVAYLPGRNGKVLGLSKLPRLVELMAARPVLQEQLGCDVTKALCELPHCLGAGCVVHGKHYCMAMRGVKQRKAITTTSSLRGLFKEDATVRQEFFALTGSR